MAKKIKKDSFFENIKTEALENEITHTFREYKHKKLKLNRKQRKQQNLQKRYEELKINVSHPELVQLEDVSAVNPYLLNQYKSVRNSVKVPDFWKYRKLKYKHQEDYFNPFYDSYISRKRDSYYEYLENLSEKDIKRRKKYPQMKNEYFIPRKLILDSIRTASPKMFLIIPGIPYNSEKGLQKEKSLNHLENISKRLRRTLGMKNNFAPPWLYNIQRIGMPPNIKMKIPGLNCPIPIGCEYGYEEGQWGQLPTNLDGSQKYVYEEISDFEHKFFIFDEGKKEKNLENTEIEIKKIK